MSATLDPDVALQLAGALKTIVGANYLPQSAVEELARDLIRWCKGVILDRVFWSPEQQAEWLVTEARTYWETWSGSAALYRMFRAKFYPESVREPNEWKPPQGEKPQLFGEWWTPEDQAQANARKARRDKMWQELRRELKVEGWNRWPSWNKIADAAEKLGYKDYARAWRLE